jgi:CHAT domain-containing protein
VQTTLSRLGILILLTAGVSRVLGQPVPAPPDKAGDQTTEQQQLLTKASQLAAEAAQLHERGDLVRARALLEQALEIRRKAYPRATYPDGHPDLCRIINNLGVVYQEAGEPAKAEALLREGLVMARALFPRQRFPNGHSALFHGLNNLACLHRSAGEDAKAEPLYREALAMTRALYPRERFPSGHPDLVRGLNNLGFLHQDAGEHTKAERLYREALAMARALFPRERFPHGDADLARSLNNLGSLHLGAGEHGLAEPLLREALAMRRALFPRERFPSGHPELAVGIYNLGSLHQAAGEHTSAEPLYREALAMRRALFPKARFPSGHRDLAVTLMSLGYLHDDAGERARAEPLLREALAMCRALYPSERFPRGHPDLAASINNLAGLHRHAGLYTEAEPLFREALAMRRALYPKERFPRGHPALAFSINSLGLLRQEAGERAKAEPLLREALAMRRALFPKERFPSGHRDLAESINNLGFLHQGSGELAKAEPLLREALAMKRELYPTKRFPSGHLELAISLHNLGLVYHDAGAHDRAAPVLGEALAMCGQLLHQHADLAAEAECRNFAAALPQTRDALLSSSRHLAESPAAYEALWHCRALLTRVQERRHRDLLASADHTTAALADELQETRRSLARLLLGPGRDADAHRRLVERLTETKEDLEKRIAAKLRLAKLGPAAAVTTVKQLQSALPAGAAFVDLLRYVYVEQDAQTPRRKGAERTDYVAFVVAKGQPVARVELEGAERIEAAWAAWHRALVAPGGDPKNERGAAHVIARLVWEPIRRVLPADCRTVYLTPDGALTQVPWAALPGRKPDSVLLDEHAVCLVSHGPWLLERLTTPASVGGKPPVDTLLTYGGIDYEGAPAVVAKGRGLRELALVGEAALPAPTEKRLHWAALPGTAREQAQVAALAKHALKTPPVVRSGRAASVDQLLEDLPKARYAHLATHGFFADAKFRSYLQVDPKLYERGSLGERRSAGARSPLVLSGLVLAGANRRGKDAAPDRGIVTAEGLIGLRLEGLELTVLSACDTGLGEVAGGEGVFGLQRAFHIAGCQNVITSLWQVDDEATPALMALFYHKLWVEKLPTAEALRQAQLTLYRHPERVAVLARERGPDFTKAARLPATPEAATRAPTRLWAGFVLSGLGR